MNHKHWQCEQIYGNGKYKKFIRKNFSTAIKFTAHTLHTFVLKLCGLEIKQQECVAIVCV